MSGAPSRAAIFGAYGFLSPATQGAPGRGPRQRAGSVAYDGATQRSSGLLSEHGDARWRGSVDSRSRRSLAICRSFSLWVRTTNDHGCTLRAEGLQRAQSRIILNHTAWHRAILVGADAASSPERFSDPPSLLLC